VLASPAATRYFVEMSRRLLLLPILLLLLGAAPVPGGDPGALVVIGGGLSADNEAVYRAILEARDGPGPLCVIGTAGADPEGSAATAVRRIDRWGGEGTARAHPLPEDDLEAARDPEVVAALGACSGYFFTGGVQSRILRLFRPQGEETPAWAALMQRWREGAVVAGSSAGAAMMSDPMIAGGSSEGAFRNGIGEGGVQLSPGMGFLPELLVDQHFLARGRIGRLLVATLDEGGVPLGAGIDENTALVIRGTELEVVGASGVVVVDAREAAPIPEGVLPAGVGGVRLELLGPGDRFSLERGAMVRPAGGKVPLPPLPHYEWEGPEGRFFDRWVLLHFLDGVGRETRRGAPGSVGLRVDGDGALRFHRGEGFRALGFEGGQGAGVEGTPAGLSVGPLLVEVRRGWPPPGEDGS
jgi:cyanophycinase